MCSAWSRFTECLYTVLQVVVQGRMTVNLMVGVTAALCGMFTFGYNTGVINSPKKVSTWSAST